LTPDEASLLQQLTHAESKPPQIRAKGFWRKMKEALGA